MTDTELTRRDAIVALATTGIAVTATGALTWDYLEADDGPSGDGTVDDPLTAQHRETLVALAEVVYPSAVSGIPEFVETYVVGRLDDQPDRRTGIVDAVGELDSYATEKTDTEFRKLDVAAQNEVLDGMGVDVVDPDPDGFGAERVRFYLVNELLYALYASPTGGKLVGLENPQGYPGGTDSYQHGPE